MDADADANAVWMLRLMLLPMLMPMPMPLPTPMHTSDLLLLHVDYLGGGTASCVWMLRLMPLAVANADAHQRPATPSCGLRGSGNCELCMDAEANAGAVAVAVLLMLMYRSARRLCSCVVCSL